MVINMIADIVLVVLITLFALAGRKKGLIKGALGLVSMVAALLISAVVTGPVIAVLEGTALYRSFYTGIAEKIFAGEAAAIFGGIADTAVAFMLKIILSVIIFILIMALLKLFTGALDSIFRLPLLRIVNSAGGLLLGLVKGFLFVYIALIIWGCFTLLSLPPILEDTTLLKSMFTNNILLTLFL